MLVSPSFHQSARDALVQTNCSVSEHMKAYTAHTGRKHRFHNTVLTLFVLLLSAPIAWGATLTVTSTEDGITGAACPSASNCTLREAIASANAGETIQFDQSLAGETIVLSGSALTISKPLTIDGSASSSNPVSIGAQDKSRVFEINADTTLKDMSIQRCGSTACSDSNPAAKGGAILVDAGKKLTLDFAPVGSSIAQQGGCIYVSSGGVLIAKNTTQFVGCRAIAPNGTSKGGAIYNDGGTIKITASAVGSTTGNAAGQGAGIYNNGGTINLDGAAFASDSASQGGAIYSHGGTIAGTDNNPNDDDDSKGNSNFTGNTASKKGGAIYLTGGATATFLNKATFSGNFAGTTQTKDDNDNTIAAKPGYGGAIYIDGNSNTLSVNTVSFKNNQAQTSGGAIYNDGGEIKADTVTFSGNTATALPDSDTPNAKAGGGAIYSEGGSFSSSSPLENLTFSGNGAGSTDEDNPHDGAGGALLLDNINDLTITNASFQQNAATKNGGALFGNNVSDVTLDKATFQSNTASANGGSIAISGNGDMTVKRSSLLGTSGGQLKRNAQHGGAIHVSGGTLTLQQSTVAVNGATRGGGIAISGGTLTATNDTITGNRAQTNDDSNPSPGDGSGGGIYISGGTATLNFVTIARNTAENNGGGMATTAGSGSVKNSIVADNTATNGAHDNFDTSAFSTADNVTGADAGLQKLLFRGGLTPTIPLADDSPALKKVTGCSLTMDQRGAPRPDTDGDCDAGAFQRTSIPVVPVSRLGVSSLTLEHNAANIPVLEFEIKNTTGNNIGIEGITAQLQAFSANVQFNLITRNCPDKCYTLLVKKPGDSSYTRKDKFASAQMTFDNNVAIPSGKHADFKIILNETSHHASVSKLVQTPLLAGGLLIALLGLFRIGRKRRAQWFLMVLVLALGLTACSKGDSPFQGFQFQLTNIEFANQNTPSKFIAPQGLPVDGPIVSVKDTR